MTASPELKRLILEHNDEMLAMFKELNEVMNRHTDIGELRLTVLTWLLATQMGGLPKFARKRAVREVNGVIQDQLRLLDTLTQTGGSA